MNRSRMVILTYEVHITGFSGLKSSGLAEVENICGCENDNTRCEEWVLAG